MSVAELENDMKNMRRSIRSVRVSFPEQAEIFKLWLKLEGAELRRKRGPSKKQKAASRKNFKKLKAANKAYKKKRAKSIFGF